MLCFLETPVLRFTLLPYYRRKLEISEKQYSPNLDSFLRYLTVVINSKNLYVLGISMVIFLLYGFFWLLRQPFKDKSFRRKTVFRNQQTNIQQVGFFTKVFETFVFWLVLNFLGVFCSVGSNKLSNLEKEIIQFSE